MHNFALVKHYPTASHVIDKLIKIEPTSKEIQREKQSIETNIKRYASLNSRMRNFKHDKTLSILSELALPNEVDSLNLEGDGEETELFRIVSFNDE